MANQAKALLLEQGIVVAKGITRIRKFLPIAVENLENRLSMTARDYLSELYAELVTCDELVEKYESRIISFAKNDEACKRLQKIPGVGPITATAIVVHAADATEYKNGRGFAASLGLTPKEHSSGGKQKLPGISKRGSNTIRKLLIQGARIITRYALANKTARIIWNLLAKKEEYRPVMA